MKRLVTISAAFLLLVLMSVPILAQHQHGAGQRGQQGAGYQAQQGPEAGGMYGQLTEEQHEAMVALTNAHRQEVMQHNLKLRAKNAELDVLLAAPEVDQSAVDSVTSEIVNLRGEILKLQNDMRRKVFEETGHLMRGGKGFGKGHGMSGRGMMSGKGRMANCPMMSGQPADVTTE